MQPLGQMVQRNFHEIYIGKSTESAEYFKLFAFASLGSLRNGANQLHFRETFRFVAHKFFLHAFGSRAGVVS
jgi:hypothetical protein